MAAGVLGKVKSGERHGGLSSAICQREQKNQELVNLYVLYIEKKITNPRYLNQT